MPTLTCAIASRDLIAPIEKWIGTVAKNYFTTRRNGSERRSA
jgi:hypothetical protein